MKAPENITAPSHIASPVRLWTLLWNPLGAAANVPIGQGPKLSRDDVVRVCDAEPVIEIVKGLLALLDGVNECHGCLSQKVERDGDWPDAMKRAYALLYAVTGTTQTTDPQTNAPDPAATGAGGSTQHGGSSPCQAPET